VRIARKFACEFYLRRGIRGIASKARASQISDNYSPREVPSALNGSERIAGTRGGQFLGKMRTKGSEKAETPSNIPRENQLRIAGKSTAN